MDKVINITMRILAIIFASITCMTIAGDTNSMAVKSIGLVVYFLLIDSILHFKAGTTPWK